MRTAIAKRQDVMHFLNRRQPAFLFAKLAKRVGKDVLGADPFPIGAIALVCFWITLVAVVKVIHLLLMVWAVSFMCQLRATGIRTWTLWFFGQKVLLRYPT